MINWIKSWFRPTEEDKKVIEAIKKADDMWVGPRGGLHRDPKVVASQIDWEQHKKFFENNKCEGCGNLHRGKCKVN